VKTPLGTFKAEGCPPNTAIHVAVRPEHVALGPGIDAIVKDVVYQGSFKRVTAALVAAPEIALLARLPVNAPVKADARLSLAIDPEHVILLKD